MPEYIINLRSTKEHPQQDRFVTSEKKRIIVRAGRRGGKTVGAAKKAIRAFLNHQRVLYAAPTIQQVDAFWFEVCQSLRAPISAGKLKKNESEHTIEVQGTKTAIRAKTAWNADTLRGDYADLLILDEFQMMAEDAWGDVGAPMLADNNGTAVFIYTPPSLLSQGTSKARDPRHASKLFKKALADTTGIWQAIHFTSHDNPFISQEGLAIIAQDMSLDSYRREIMAEDDEIETSWLVYGKFNESKNKIKRFTIPANWDVYSGHDFGSANPAALFVARAKLPLPAGAPESMRYGDLVAFREYAPGGGYSAAQHIDRFKELTKGYEVVKRTGGNLTTEDEIRQGYAAQGWQISPPPENMGRQNVQIDRVISVMEANKLYIFEDMVLTLSQIANCLWELDNENKPINKIKDEARFHMLATLRYLLSIPEFTPETIGNTDKIKVIHWGK